MDDDHTNDKLVEELQAISANAMRTIMESVDRQLDVVIIIGDGSIHHLMITGSHCTDCTNNLINAAHECAERYEAGDMMGDLIEVPRKH